MVIWLTGMSGAGKSTLAHALIQAMQNSKIGRPVLVDGDLVRASISQDLGYSAADRLKQISRVSGLAKMLAVQGFPVVVAAVYNDPESMRKNRQEIPGYFEVYLQCGMDFLMKRDSKGIYARAREGKAKDVVGVDIPWIEPEKPDLVFQAEEQIPPSEMAARILKALPKA